MNIVHLGKENLKDFTKHLCFNATEGIVYEVHIALNNFAQVFKIADVGGLAMTVDVELTDKQLRALIELCVGVPVKEEIVKKISVVYKYTLVYPPLELTPSKPHEFPTHLNKAVEFKANPKAAPNIFDIVPNRTDTPPKRITDEDLRVIERSKSTPKPEGDTVDVTDEVINLVNSAFNSEINNEEISIEQYTLSELIVKNSNTVEIVEIRSVGDAGIDFYLLHTLNKNWIRVHINFTGLAVFRRSYPDIDYPTSKVYLSKSSLEALRNLITKRLTSQLKK